MPKITEKQSSKTLIRSTSIGDINNQQTNENKQLLYAEFPNISRVIEHILAINSQHQSYIERNHMRITSTICQATLKQANES